MTRARSWGRRPSDFDNATFSSSEGASNSSTGAYVEWCFEEGRQAGDTTIIEDEDNSTIYVVVFLRGATGTRPRP